MILKIDQVSSCLKDITPEHTYPLLIEKMNGNGNGIEKNGEDDDKDGLEDGDSEHDVAGSSEPGEEPFPVQRPLANRKGALVLAL